MGTLMKKTISVLALTAICASAMAADYLVVVPVKGRTGAKSYDNIAVTLNPYTLPQAVVGLPYSTDLSGLVVVTGDPAYSGSGVTWSAVSSTLPAGLVLNSNGTITGTPTAAGTGSILARATYKTKTGERSYDVQALNITVTLDAATLPTGQINTAYTANLASGLHVSGDSAYAGNGVSWSLAAGGLPTGLQLDSNTGVVYGTPKEVVTGKSFTARATYRGKSADQTFAVDIQGPSDPYWNNVVLLASPESGAYKDLSKYGVALTPGAGVTLDGAIAKFPGTSSMKFTSTSAGVSVPYAASKFDFTNTVTTWTVEAWVYLQGAQSNIQLYRLDVVGNAQSSSGWEADIRSNARGVTFPGYGGPTANMSISSGAWHHMVWQRSGSSYTFGMDGVIQQTSTYTGGKAASNFLKIGSNYNNSVGITYNLQEVRLTAGVARYDTTVGATYSVPTEPYPRH